MTPARVRKIRGNHGLSVVQLAEFLGLRDPERNGADRVRDYEAGRRECTGPVERLLFLLEQGLIPAEYLPAPAHG